ncbi:MAG TPA: hypothetical protein VGP25_13630 [Gemmatimonadaceae bacterium]|jgi:hypothetical protein|nr:hypothetical protein [Gemmatimonadaceae bacterium]
MSHSIDSENPVLALCAQGMAVEGTPDVARAYFEQAWNARRDDYDAAIAAHFIARQQPTAEDALHWNEIAARHAELVPDGRASALLPSLYLNLGDTHAKVGNLDRAAEAARRARESLDALPHDGYREFVAMGIGRLAERLGVNEEREAPHTDLP